ncbi:MAG: pilus assembly protein [Chloroflexi bacterium]|nr:pilus assembly protein [Chloroflexota bacterium]
MKCRLRFLTRGDGEKGQSVVELAIMMPVLLLMLLGSLDLGRAFYSYLTITNAARVGAQFAMDSRRLQTEVMYIIESESKPFVTITDSDITFTTTSWSPGYDLKIEVKTQFTAVTPLISNIWGGGPLTMRADTSTRFNSS